MNGKFLKVIAILLFASGLTAFVMRDSLGFGSLMKMPSQKAEEVIAPNEVPAEKTVDNAHLEENVSNQQGGSVNQAETVPNNIPDANSNESNSDITVKQNVQTDNVKVAEQTSSNIIHKSITEEINEKEEKRNHILNNILPTDLIYGDVKNANVRLVVYSSYSCPACSYFFSKIFPSIKDKYIDSGKASLINRSYVMSNQDINASLLVSCKSHNLGLEFSKVLYEKQNNWATKRNYTKILADIAKMAGVSQTDFDQCLSDENIKKDILQLRVDANKHLNIGASPTVYINGREISNPLSIEEISTEIDRIINN